MIDELESQIQNFHSSERIELFHGSQNGIDGEIRHDHPAARHACDFGQAFYMGTLRIQAKTIVRQEGKASLLTLEANLDGLNIVKFRSLAWALAVAWHRGKFENTSLSAFLAERCAGADVIAGPIADDKLYASLEKFFSGDMTDAATVRCVSVLNLGVQYAAKTEKADKNITVKSVELIDINDNDFAIMAALRKEALAKMEKIRIEFRRQGRYFDEIIDEFEKDCRARMEKKHAGHRTARFS